MSQIPIWNNQSKFHYVTTQFQAFTHPESSHSILAQEAEELFGRHDADGDGTISEAEYLKDPFVEFDEDELQDRRRTFRQGLDADKVSKTGLRPEAWWHIGCHLLLDLKVPGSNLDKD